MAVTYAEATKCISFASHSAYSPSSANIIEVGTPTDVEMTFLNLGDGSGSSSDKFDFGTTWAEAYRLAVAMEWQVTAPTTGTSIDFYMGYSDQSTAANGNPGYLAGSDSVYLGTPATLAEGLAQLDYIGSIILSADLAVQIDTNVGFLIPKARYGILVAINNGAQTLCDTDVVETAAVLIPITRTSA